MLPAAQPATAPIATHAAVVEARSMPAPAGWNVGREVGSIAASIPKLVTPEDRHFSTKSRDFWRTSLLHYRAARAAVPRRHRGERAAARLRARQRRRRCDHLGGAARAGRPPHAADPRPARLPAQPAP